MTNQERAEKIVREISYVYSDTRLRGIASEQITFVLAQLDEAQETVRDQCFTERYVEGFWAAREKAKGIAAECVPCWGDPQTGPESCQNNEVCELHFNIARRISELEP